MNKNASFEEVDQWWMISIRPELSGDHSRVPSKAVLRDPDASHVSQVNSFHFEIHKICRKNFGIFQFRLICEILLKSDLSFCEFQK